MTDETDIPARVESEAEDNDPRFEVKWRKKESTSPPPPSDQPPADSESPADIATLLRELADERQRVKDLQDRWQRAAADLVNLRRRTEAERGEMEKFASMMLVHEMLPVLDNFERAIATIPGNLSMLTWIQGIALIERHLRAILEHQGLSAIEAMGQPFNPHVHEAVGERETGDSAPGTVITEYQRGYTMHDRVIRPTLVELAKEPAASEPEPIVTTEADTTDITEQMETENAGP